jgi:hypothetical protein
MAPPLRIPRGLEATVLDGTDSMVVDIREVLACATAIARAGGGPGIVAGEFG